MGHPAPGECEIEGAISRQLSGLKHVFLGEFAFDWARVASALHLVHGAVGGFEQGVNVVTVFRKAGEADTRGEVEGAAFKVERLIGFLGEALDNGEQIVAVGDITEDDAEFIAAEACDEVRSPWNAADAQRHFAQGRIAGAVAVAVVDALESVHVDDEDAQGVNLAATR